MEQSTEEVVTITTTRSRAEIIRASVAHHAMGVRYCAETPGEGWDDARHLLARVEEALGDVTAALARKEAA